MKTMLMRKKSATAVVAASRRWAAAAAESLAELLRPELAEGESLPDLQLLQELLGRALARRWRRLETAEQARDQARDRRRQQVGEKRTARAVLYRRVVDLRRMLRGVFGGAACRRLLGIAGETSRDDVLLLRQARHLVARLAASPGELPPAFFQLTKGEVARWAAPVEAAIEDLHTASSLAAIGVKEAEAADADLRRAIADFDSVLVRVGSLLTGVHTGAGREQRARAVRPSRRRLGRLLTDDDRAGKSRAARGRAKKTIEVKARLAKPSARDVSPAGAEQRRLARKARAPDSGAKPPAPSCEGRRRLLAAP